VHEDLQRERDRLQVVELGTWSTIYSARLRNRVDFASFFADGQRLYARSASFALNDQVASQQVIVDVRTGMQTERLRVHEREPSEVVIPRAVKDGMLLGTEYNRRTHNTEAMVQLELPEYRERARVIYESPGRQSDEFFWANRAVLAYGLDHTVVCRRTNDLSLIWTRRFPPEFLTASSLGVSADGAFVAVGFASKGFWHTDRKYQTSVLSGKDGSELALLALDGSESIAISPDGRLLAAGLAIPDGRNGTTPTVYLHDVSSGRQLASWAHDRVRSARGPNFKRWFLITDSWRRIHQ
jgi:hypothetical protein